MKKLAPIILSVIVIVVLFLLLNTNYKKTQNTLPIDVNSSTKNSTDEKNDSQLIKESFDQYKSALMSQDGKRAAEYVNDKTIAYYMDLLNLVKRGKKSEVQNKRIVDKFSILAIRHRFASEVIKLQDGKSLLAFAVNEGLIGEQSVSSLSFNASITASAAPRIPLPFMQL